ncbi:1-deoxy-D-xylulose-5-phosphate reductoisomerase [Uliginosibacterium sp. H1]|uniref:1-deoxy-D-xylulose-5-phosphate reductoisomerase n=1 Tax=Uliginosibacterium sp. H1 TaxID=3114757 RepID=UPI002E191C55|nr:1-deoxy-D-xylulose-5-phosphate reductoisomerase [Uliginosibacterium sp. H1]
MSKQVLTVLGATGSIGVSTLDVVARHPERFEVFALTGNRQIERLAQQCQQFQPRYAVVADDALAADLRSRLGPASRTDILVGRKALVEVAEAAEVTAVMAAIVGAAGLESSLAAAQAGKRVLLANKESLVLAGSLFMDAVCKAGATLLPIDSEHNALFQSLPTGFDYGLQDCGVSRLVLTASGGPFRCTPVEQLDGMTPTQACAHPNWVMGRKISVDSASMMNKGLEVIEARWLFGVEPGRIGVLIHPESVIHSMVEYVDGSVIAQLGNPDMRTPIAHAMAWPERIASGVERLNLAKVGKLSFEEPDLQRFPCLRLAFDALQAGGDACAVLNAANEEAVAAFLEGRLGFTGIAAVVESVLARSVRRPVAVLEDALFADASARELARAEIVSRQQ